MTYIDPSTCDASSPYLLRLPDNTEAVGLRDDPDDGQPWRVMAQGWRSDDEVTVLAKLVPEMSDVYMCMHIARTLGKRFGSASTANALRAYADRIDRELKTKRDALVEKFAAERGKGVDGAGLDLAERVIDFMLDQQEAGQ